MRKYIVSWADDVNWRHEVETEDIATAIHLQVILEGGYNLHGEQHGVRDVKRIEKEVL